MPMSRHSSSGLLRKLSVSDIWPKIFTTSNLAHLPKWRPKYNRGGHNFVAETKLPKLNWA